MVYVHEMSLANALGCETGEILSNLESACAPGLSARTDLLTNERAGVFGSVRDELPVPEGVPAWLLSRNNRLLELVLRNMPGSFRARLAACESDRVAVILGTSTSGSEEADRFIASAVAGNTQEDFDARIQELGSPSVYLSHRLGITGPAYTVSTACTSSTRAIISGARLIEAGIVDLAIVGGVDTLARNPVNGFDSLSALSTERCEPFSATRHGITIGEGAGLMVLSQAPSDIVLAGYGESSDAHHVSAPEPTGKGAEKAMRMALERARIAPSDIGWINAHGTATMLNDSAEAMAIGRVFGSRVPVSSTKNLTGHTLGAAGITDAGLCVLALRDRAEHAIPAQFAPGAGVDPHIEPIGLVSGPLKMTGRYVMSNNFAFGGNNASLVFGRIDD